MFKTPVQTGEEITAAHISPDHDAAFSLWLMHRYGGYEGAQIEFLDARNPDPVLLEKAHVIVDVGGELDLSDPAHIRADHHLEGMNDTCAATIVADWLRNKGADIEHLDPLIEIVLALDTGKISRESKFSDELGIHAALRGLSRSGMATDFQLVKFCFALYDGLELELRRKYEARKRFDQSLVHTGMNGAFMAVSSGLGEGDRDLAELAAERGAQVTLFSFSYTTEDDRVSHACALRRADMRAAAPDIGSIVKQALSCLQDDFREAFRQGSYTKARRLSDCIEELKRWYIHPHGYYAGRGIRVAPCYDPVEADLTLLAQYIEQAWAELYMPRLHVRVLSFLSGTQLQGSIISALVALTTIIHSLSKAGVRPDNITSFLPIGGLTG